jgi:hypothetical protein
MIPEGLIYTNLFEIKIFKYTIPDWQTKKKVILDLVNETGLEYKGGCGTDYYSGRGRAPYFDKWYGLLKEDFDRVLPTFGLPLAPPETWQIWTQTYHRGDYHAFHNHGTANLSAVLYLEFDPNEHQTTVFTSPYPDPFFGTLFDRNVPDVQEGDIIFFPAMLGHQCVPQTSDKPRTVMSFNIPLT